MSRALEPRERTADLARHGGRLDDGPDWSELIGRVVDDLARIVHAEFRLFDAELEQTIQRASDRAIFEVVLAMILTVGGLCLLAAVTLMLHQFTPWWLSFAIVGAATVVAASAAAGLIRGAPKTMIADSVSRVLTEQQSQRDA